MLLELKEEEVEMICSALKARSNQLKLEWSVSQDDELMKLSDNMYNLIREMTDQVRKNQVRKFFPGT